MPQNIVMHLNQLATNDGIRKTTRFGKGPSISIDPLHDETLPEFIRPIERVDIPMNGPNENGMEQQVDNRVDDIQLEGNNQEGEVGGDYGGANQEDERDDIGGAHEDGQGVLEGVDMPKLQETL